MATTEENQNDDAVYFYSILKINLEELRTQP